MGSYPAFQEKWYIYLSYHNFPPDKLHNNITSTENQKLELKSECNRGAHDIKSLEKHYPEYTCELFNCFYFLASCHSTLLSFNKFAELDTLSMPKQQNCILANKIYTDACKLVKTQYL